MEPWGGELGFIGSQDYPWDILCTAQGQNQRASVEAAAATLVTTVGARQGMEKRQVVLVCVQAHGWLVLPLPAHLLVSSALQDT